jgi:hypothetical protein
MQLLLFDMAGDQCEAFVEVAGLATFFQLMWRWSWSQ